MNIFKKILFILLNILMIPVALIATAGITWYMLPALKTINVGLWIGSIISEQAIFWITIISVILLLVLFVVDKIFDKSLSARTKNFFIHSYTWLSALLAIVLSTLTFIFAEIEVTTFTLTNTRKIGIGICFVLLFLTVLFSQKISKVVNRRIQAYENSKELNIVGRGSIIFTNLLKLLELLFPQVIVLTLICFCLSTNVALYFILILIAFTIPMFGNIDCDLNIRKEIVMNEEKEKDILVSKISNNMRVE